MGGLLDAHYPQVYGIGLSNATPKQFRDAFDKYAITGPTLRKARTFFLHAAVYAGVPLSSFNTKEVKQRGGEGIKRPTSTRKAPRKPVQKRASDSATGTASASVLVVDPALADRPLLRVVMGQLPTENKWTQAERDRWMKLFTEALDWDVKLGNVK